MGNKYNFDKVIDRRVTNSYKWDLSKDEYSYSIADMDFDVAPEIKNKIIELANEGPMGYTYVPKEYFEAYKRWWKSRYQVDIDISWCLFSTSIVASVDTIISRLTELNDKISLLSPNYNVFYRCISNNKRQVEEIPFEYKDYSYGIDWDLFEEKLSQSKMFILCNPHNPIGKAFNTQEINRIIELCRKYDVYLVSDEIHADIDYNGKKYVSVLYNYSYDKMIVLLSPGKTFNLAGLHSSIVIIKDKELRSLIEKGLMENDVGEATFFSAHPVIEAYTKCDEYVYELNEYLKANKEYLVSYIKNNNLDLKIVGGDYTYLLWIDISRYSNNSDEFVESLFKQEKVKLLPGSQYHEHYSTFVRVNIATSLENIKILCESLKRFLTK